MKTIKLTAAMAGVALATMPLAAQAQPRDTAPVSAESELGGSPIAVIAAVGVAALIAIALITETDDDDEPVSP